MQQWLNSTRHAWRGILLMWKEERNLRIETIIALLAILAGWWLNISMLEWCLIILCIAGVLAAEAFNTSIEELSDYRSKEWDPGIKNIKDIAAGAVLIMAIMSILIGALILGPKLWMKLL